MSDNVTSSTADELRTAASPQGVAIAYGSLVVMSLIPIFIGSIRSVKQQKQQQILQTVETPPDYVTIRDALQLPIIASVALVGLYAVLKIFTKDNINLLLTGYFFVLGVLALSHLICPLCSKLMPAAVPNVPFHITFTKGESPRKTHLIDYQFSSFDIVCLILSTLIGVWYLHQKHWIANNLFVLAFAVNGIELLHLNNMATGCVLLSGLFVYDIFWVFGTNVMITVARNFDAPIKLVFPMDILANGWSASNFAILGLGDIVVPGIFIALLLRFDHSLKRKTRLYFYVTLIAYLLGLMTTIFVMHKFRHAQPALLYLVPICIAAPLLLALLNNELKVLFAYQDFETAAPETNKYGNKKKKAN